MYNSLDCVVYIYESVNCVALQFFKQLLNSSIPAYICTCTLYSYVYIYTSKYHSM